MVPLKRNRTRRNQQACARSSLAPIHRDDATFDRAAASFDNPDYVAIVIHNYRYRLGLAEGESRYDDLENKLAAAPVITVPTITLEGDANGAAHTPDDTPYRRNSPANTPTGSSRAASGTICPRKRRRPSPRLSWILPQVDRRKRSRRQTRVHHEKDGANDPQSST